MVSIVVPVYNMEKFLPRCMDTLVSQSSDYEIILVDDGSTDRSPELCDDYRQRYPSLVRVIHKRNSGLSSARNAGIEAAKGTYVIFPDPDDWVEPNYVSKMVEFQNYYQPDLLCVGYYVDTDGKCVPANEGQKTHYMDRAAAQQALFIPPKMGGFAWNKLDGYCFNKIYRMDIIQTNRIRFHSGITFGEDIAFNLSYLKYVDNIVGLPKCLYCYNADNLESATRKFDAYRFENHRYVYHLRKPFIAPYYRKAFSNGFYDICMWDIECIFDKKNVWKFRKKIKYSNYILRTSEFRECVKMGASDGMNRWYLAALHTGNYLLVKFLENIRMLLNKTARKKG